MCVFYQMTMCFTLVNFAVCKTMEMNRRRSSESRWYDSPHHREFVGIQDLDTSPSSSFGGRGASSNAGKTERVSNMEWSDSTRPSTASRGISAISNSPVTLASKRKKYMSRRSSIRHSLTHTNIINRPKSGALGKYDPLPAIGRSPPSQGTSEPSHPGGNSRAKSEKAQIYNLEEHKSDHDSSSSKNDGNLNLARELRGSSEHVLKNRDFSTAMEIINPSKDKKGDDLPESSSNKEVEAEEEENTVTSYKEEGDLRQDSAMFKPPKLLRSNTFEVIETNLTEHPIIESDDNESSVFSPLFLDSNNSAGNVSDVFNDNPGYIFSHQSTSSNESDDNKKSISPILDPNEMEDYPLDDNSENRSSNSLTDSYDDEEFDDFQATINPLHVCRVNIDGLSLQDFLSQTTPEYRSASAMYASNSTFRFGSPTERPGSSSSLLTHPPTPDSGIDGPLNDSFLNHSSARSQTYVLKAGDEVDWMMQRGIAVKFPDDSLVISTGTLSSTLEDFLALLRNMKWAGRMLHIAEEVEDKYMKMSLRDLGMTENVTVNLVSETL